jgi:Tol biopolymer transport system component
LSLSPGTRLGVYEITALIGEGGMGRVFRARDTTLKRDVAIKVLPPSFTTDPDRLARFQREAEVLASLNHANIAQIHGLETCNGIRALVMELVEGEDLAQHIARGAIPIDEALPIATQIAEALKVAHEQGIMHRDLKPANIKVRPDGTVKVLDFGLAKAMESNGSAPNISQSPTITTPAMTRAGMILGSAAYMSPEQAKGKPLDKRADIWAFGAVLFEMLTAQRAFGGADVADTLAAVLRVEPDWTVLPGAASFPIRTLLRGCLEKDAPLRIADISAALFVLRYLVAGAATEGVSNAGHGGGADVRRLARFTTAALMLGAAAAGTGVWWSTRPARPSVVRTTITTGGPTALVLQGADRDLAITPDGSHVIYRGNHQLLVRALGRLEPSVLTGSGSPQGAFVSPDGKWVGYFDGATIKKVAIAGGPPVTITSGVGGGPRGATWGPDGTIIFATATEATGLQRVSAAGAEPTVLTTLDRERGDGDHIWPEFLPGGEAVLFTITSLNRGIGTSQIALLDLRTGTSKVLLHGGSDAHYIPTGHLIYGFSGTLRAVAFDLTRLEVVGTPEPVLEGVVTTSQGAVDVAVSANGSLVYVPGGSGESDQRTIEWVDRQGRATLLPGLPLDAYRDVRVSPNGAALALATEADVWVYDFARAARSRLTTDQAVDRSPLWTPDSRRIVVTSKRAGYPELFWRPADGSGRDERILTRAKDLIDLRANSWSADGRRLLFTEVPRDVQNAIGHVSIDRTSDASLLLAGPTNNDFAAVSPNGRWVAYQSRISGQTEIYAERYPELGDRQTISTGGGRLPLWSRDGQELFFSSADGQSMLVVAVQSGTTLVAGRPKVLFESSMFAQGLGVRPYDLAPNGRFVIIRSGQPEPGDSTAQNLVFVQNWLDELKHLAAAK